MPEERNEAQVVRGTPLMWFGKCRKLLFEEVFGNGLALYKRTSQLVESLIDEVFIKDVEVFATEVGAMDLKTWCSISVLSPSGRVPKDTNHRRLAMTDSIPLELFLHPTLYQCSCDGKQSRRRPLLSGTDIVSATLQCFLKLAQWSREMNNCEGGTYYYNMSFEDSQMSVWYCCWLCTRLGCVGFGVRVDEWGHDAIEFATTTSKYLEGISALIEIISCVNHNEWCVEVVPCVPLCLCT